MQLAALGFTGAELRSMVSRGELLRLHRAVYALGHRSPAAEARWAAALLFAGPGAALSHTAAAAVHGLMTERSVIEVTAPTQRRGDGMLVVHRKQLDEDEVVRVRGLRVTAVGRTLLDLAAARWPVDRLAQAAVASSLVSLNDLRAYADAQRGNRGAKALHAAVRRPHVRSRAETRLLRFLRRQGIEPEMNYEIGRLHVDAYVPDLRLAVELDPEQTHGTARAAQDDAWRDRYLRARGITTLRIDEDDYAVLAAEIRRRRAPALRSGRLAPGT